MRRALFGATLLGAAILVLLQVIQMRVRAEVFDDVAGPPIILSQSPHIVFLGTSLTANYQWPEQLQTDLEACFKAPVSITKIALGGATSRWGTKQLDQALELSPDVVFIEFMANDADLRNQLSLAESRRVHEAMITEIQERSHQASIVLLATNPARGLRALLRPSLRHYYKAYREIAQNSELWFVDLYSSWRTAEETQHGLYLDGIHPTPEATAAIVAPRLATLFNTDC